MAPCSGTAVLACRPTVSVMSLRPEPSRNRWLALPSKATFLTRVSIVASFAPLPSTERFGPDEQDRLAADRETARIAAAQRAEMPSRRSALALTVFTTRPANGLFSPTKEATNGVSRLIVDRLAVADLLDDALVHDRDAVRHGQRFALIVGDVDEGDADALLDGAQLVAHMLAKLEIERRKRLIEQQHLGLDGERAGDGDALTLAAGQLADELAALPRQLDQLEKLIGLALALLARQRRGP